MEGITMKSSQDSNEKQTAARKAKRKASSNEPRHSQRKKEEEGERPAHKDASTAPIRPVVTEEQYRARVSQKAYALYEKRQAVTHLNDWFEAERLVKTELLAEGQWAGSV
jgi:hypothetical protein